MAKRGLRVKVEIIGEDALMQAMRRKTADVAGEMREAAQAGSDVLLREASRLAPGPHLISEVVESDKRHVTISVGPDREHWYYQFFETGTAPHEITGKPLIFGGEAGTVVTYKVAHPGMAAEPFLRPAFDEHKDAAEAAVGDHLKAIVETR